LKSEILIRADGNNEIGLGHLVRCSALAEMLKNDFNISFFCREIPDKLQREFVAYGFHCQRISNESEFIDQISDNSIVILDGYGFDTDYQKNVKGTGARLACIDDLHDKEFVSDLIINHSPGVKPEDYKSEAYTRFALGLEYALLRPAFIEQAGRIRKNEETETVLICFGGSDRQNLTQKTLQVIAEFPQFNKIILITGPAFNHTKSLMSIVTSDNRISYRHALNEQQMLTALLEANLAIVPASGILLEAICCSNLPLICFYSENQKDLHLYMNNFIGINSFGDNTLIFQSANLRSQLQCIDLKNTQNLTSLRKSMSSSPTNHLNLFRSIIR